MYGLNLRGGKSIESLDLMSEFADKVPVAILENVFVAEPVPCLPEEMMKERAVLSRDIQSFRY